MSTLIDGFARDHDEVELRVVQEPRAALIAGLSHRRIDAAVVFGRVGSAFGDTIVIDAAPLFAALDPSDALCSRERIAWRELSAARLMISAHETGAELRTLLTHRFAFMDLRPDLRVFDVDEATLSALAGLGFGVALVHRCESAATSVVFRPVGEDDDHAPVTLVWRPETDNPALRRLVARAQKMLLSRHRAG